MEPTNIWLFFLNEHLSCLPSLVLQCNLPCGIPNVVFFFKSWRIHILSHFSNLVLQMLGACRQPVQNARVHHTECMFLLPSTRRAPASHNRCFLGCLGSWSAFIARRCVYRILCKLRSAGQGGGSRRWCSGRIGFLSNKLINNDIIKIELSIFQICAPWGVFPMWHVNFSTLIIIWKKGTKAIYLASW
jgi:hypothetical protein